MFTKKSATKKPAAKTNATTTTLRKAMTAATTAHSYVSPRPNGCAPRQTAALALALTLAASLLSGCAYKGGKVIDGTNFAIGMTIPGTEWQINALDYVGGLRVAGQDSTHIIVSNEVIETNSYFGCVTTSRHSKMTADIEPLDRADSAK